MKILFITKNETLTSTTACSIIVKPEFISHKEILLLIIKFTSFKLDS